MKAIFEVKFKLSDMIDKKSLKTEYGNNVFLLMKELYNEEGLGIFSEELELKKITK